MEAGKSSRGTQVYISNPDVLDVILNVLRRRERKMLAQADSSYQMLSKLNPESLQRANVNPDRVTAMGRMIDQAQTALNSLLELSTLDLKHWEDINESKAEAKKAPK